MSTWAIILFIHFETAQRFTSGQEQNKKPLLGPLILYTSNSISFMLILAHLFLDVSISLVNTCFAFLYFAIFCVLYFSCVPLKQHLTEFCVLTQRESGYLLMETSAKSHDIVSSSIFGLILSIYSYFVLTILPLCFYFFFHYLLLLG